MRSSSPNEVRAGELCRSIVLNEIWLKTLRHEQRELGRSKFKSYAFRARSIQTLHRRELSKLATYDHHRFDQLATLIEGFEIPKFDRQKIRSALSEELLYGSLRIAVLLSLDSGGLSREIDLNKLEKRHLGDDLVNLIQRSSELRGVVPEAVADTYVPLRAVPFIFQALLERGVEARRDSRKRLAIEFPVPFGVETVVERVRENSVHRRQGIESRLELTSTPISDAVSEIALDALAHFEIAGAIGVVLAQRTDSDPARVVSGVLDLRFQRPVGQCVQRLTADQPSLAELSNNELDVLRKQHVEEAFVHVSFLREVVSADATEPSNNDPVAFARAVLAANSLTQTHSGISW